MKLPRRKRPTTIADKVWLVITTVAMVLFAALLVGYVANWLLTGLF